MGAGQKGGGWKCEWEWNGKWGVSQDEGLWQQEVGVKWTRSGDDRNWEAGQDVEVRASGSGK